MILVLGATGVAGAQVVRALLDRGEAVRAFVRDPDKAQRLFGDEVELAQGDFADPASVRAALRGAESVFLSGADDPRRVGWEISAIDAAAAAGARRLVKLSSISAAPGSPVAFWDWHGRIEQHLRRSGVPAVVLRASFYMTNVFAAADQVAREGRLYAPAGAARIGMIDPRDVGSAAAAVLSGAGHDGMTYVLTGPAAITYARVAEELTAATDRAVEFVDIPDDAARDAMIVAGMPERLAGEIVRIFAQARRGAAEQVTIAVESLTGSPPRDFARFAHDHAGMFIAEAVGAGR